MSLVSETQAAFNSAGAAPAYEEIQVRGKAIRIPSACIDGRTVIATGRGLIIAAVNGEEFVEGETVPDPHTFAAKVRQSGLNADLFTFAQKVPDVVPKFDYHIEWDNAAVVPITTVADWLENRVEYDVRKAVKKAARLGVIVKLATFDDAFVEGIASIYNETPVRQGKAFWHYRKDLDKVRRENSTYFERSAFIGAYYHDELIGFIRMVYVDRIAATLQVLSKKAHFDKKPTNALIAKAVEVCQERGVSHLMYGQYIYNDPSSSLTEFKRRNGFEHIRVPRYYIPLSLKGKLALKLKLHRGLRAALPKSLTGMLTSARSMLQRTTQT